MDLCHFLITQGLDRSFSTFHALIFGSVNPSKFIKLLTKRLCLKTMSLHEQKTSLLVSRLKFLICQTNQFA